MRDLHLASFLLALVVWLVLVAYLFALVERRDFIDQCFESAVGDQAALCRALLQKPIFFH